MTSAFTIGYGLGFRNCAIESEAEYDETKEFMKLLALEFEPNKYRLQELALKVMFMNLDKLRSMGFRQRLMVELSLRIARWRANRDLTAQSENSRDRRLPGLCVGRL